MSKTLRALAAASLCLALGLARAQNAQPVDSADPPDRAARLSLIQGDVSMQPAGEEDWAPALLNRPLTTGDKLWTEQNGRAEIQVGQAAVRLDNNTGFSFLNVDDDTVQMRMTAGVVNVRIRGLGENEHIELDTPNVAVSLLQPGSYRVEVNDAGDTTVVKVGEGEAEAAGVSKTVNVPAGKVATIRGADELVAEFGNLGGPDDFDTWSTERESRNDRVAQSQTAEYVSPEVTGYEDLHQYGTWSREPEYGYVWTPSYVGVGWAPYSYGRWTWVGPWGWTWIDDSPWGYAPFHYGRWAYARNRWCWVPGPRAVRAVYAPALVGWVGSPGVSVAVGFGGGVGWFPLGPREIYVPYRHYSARYFERVNYSNAYFVNRTYITNAYYNPRNNYQYRNRAVPGAVSAMPRTAFVAARRVVENRMHVNERELAREPSNARPPQIDPVRDSRYGGAARVGGRLPPRDIVNREVVTKRNPPPPSARYARSVGGQAQAPRTSRSDFNGNDFSVRPRQDRPPGSVPSSPKTPARMQPGLGEQRAMLGQSSENRAPENRAPENRQRTDRPSNEQLERYRQERQQQVREWQTQERQIRQDRPAAGYQQQTQERPQVERRDSQPNDQDRRPREQTSEQSQWQQMRDRVQQSQQQQWQRQREQTQRQPEPARQTPPERVQQPERNYERPRTEQPRIEQPRTQQPRPESRPPPRAESGKRQEYRNHRDN